MFFRCYRMFFFINFEIMYVFTSFNFLSIKIIICLKFSKIDYIISNMCCFNESFVTNISGEKKIVLKCIRKFSKNFIVMNSSRFRFHNLMWYFLLRIGMRLSRTIVYKSIEVQYAQHLYRKIKITQKFSEAPRRLHRRGRKRIRMILIISSTKFSFLYNGD